MLKLIIIILYLSEVGISITTISNAAYSYIRTSMVQHVYDTIL